MIDTENLDADWINEFETIDTTYNKFYKEKIDFVCITCVFVNKDNSIDHVKREQVVLRPQNILSYDILMNMIEKYKKTLPYVFDFIIKYNLTIEPSDVKHIVKHDLHEQYISEISKIDNILFDNTISMFQDLNELIVVFRNKDVKLNSYNKTVKFHTFKKKTASHKKTLKNISNADIKNIKKI